ncbi:MAG TPA: PAS domain S-box protein [Usitatibacter sp.]|nr:PAS domain S-box protein [Usitatibacter sp.]
MDDSTPDAEGTPAAWKEVPFRRLLDSLTDHAVMLLDLSGRIASWNAGAERLFGYEAAQIVGHPLGVLHPKAAVARGWAEHELDTARRIGRFEDEGWRVRMDGSIFWANAVITPVRAEDGRLVGYGKVVRDFSERREHEERLRYSEQRLRALVQGVQDYAIFMLDAAGRVATWNEGAERIKGYSAAEIVGKHMSVFYPAEARARGWPEKELEAASLHGRFEDEGWRLRKDGSRFWANVVITAVRNADGEVQGFSKITRDLTERREHEERLRQSEERYRLLLESIEDIGIIMLDAEGRVTSWNSGAQRITGYTAEEIIGESFERFFTPEDVAAGRPQAELRYAVLNRRATDRAWRVRKDGGLFWCDVAVTALHDAEGRLRGFTKVARDISERKRMEALEEQGRHLTEFLAMLAHELRNPLAPIRNAAGIIGMQADANAQVRWAHEVIERQSAQLTRLVDDLLDVSRITRGKLRLKPTPMDLNDAMRQALETARPHFDSRRQALHVDLAAKPVPINGDLTRITQVVANLLNNAAKYTPKGGEVWVESRREGDDAVVVVRDNGAGIPPQVLPSVFDLFAQGERTLDRSEGGLGIGLTLVRRIVELHGGRIAARSDGIGKGSEFEMRLPALREAHLVATTEEGDMASNAGPRQAILVVDDNADAAGMIQALLAMAGHDVEIALDGQGALDSLSRRMASTVLLDIGLPDMSGYDVARRIRALPGGGLVRIIALTGYGHEQDLQRSLDAGCNGHLVKPVMPAELFAALGESAPGIEV